MFAHKTGFYKRYIKVKEENKMEKTKFMCLNISSALSESVSLTQKDLQRSIIIESQKEQKRK